MEDRILVAVGILAAMLIAGSWLLVRHLNEKRAFDHRQSGRGKSKGGQG